MRYLRAVYAIVILTSLLRRVNTALQHGTNISVREICTKWSVFSGTVMYICCINSALAFTCSLPELQTTACGSVEDCCLGKTFNYFLRGIPPFLRHSHIIMHIHMYMYMRTHSFFTKLFCRTLSAQRQSKQQRWEQKI